MCLKNLTVSKLIFYFANFHLLVGTAVLLSFSFWAIFSGETFAYYFPKSFGNIFAFVAIPTTVFAILILILSSFALKAVVRKKKLLKTICAYLYIAVAFIEIAFLVTIFGFKSQVIGLSKPLAVATIQQLYGEASILGASTTYTWDSFQNKFKCCGYEQASDYEQSFYSYGHGFNNPWPISCCQPSDESKKLVKVTDYYNQFTSCRICDLSSNATSAIYKGVDVDCTNKNSTVYQQGCSESLSNALDNSTIYIFLIISLLLLFLILSAASLLIMQIDISNGSDIMSRQYELETDIEINTNL